MKYVALWIQNPTTTLHSKPMPKTFFFRDGKKNVRWERGVRYHQRFGDSLGGFIKYVLVQVLYVNIISSEALAVSRYLSKSIICLLLMLIVEVGTHDST